MAALVGSLLGSARSKSIAAGVGIWAVSCALPLDGVGAAWWATRFVLLATLVWVPLALGLLHLAPATADARVGVLPYPLVLFGAALLLVAAFWLPASWLAATLVAPWAVVTLLLGWRGLLRLLGHPRLTAAELCLDLGLLALPAGGAWLLAARAGGPVLGFYEPLPLLTGMHFHYAGFLAPVVVGLLGRRLPPHGGAARLYRVVAPLVCVGPWLVAIRITAGGAAEAAAGVGFAVLLGLAAGLLLSQLLPREPDRTARASIGLAGSAALLGMILAALYALGTAGLGGVSLDLMARLHGSLLALGFVGGGLLACARLQPAPRVTPDPPPLSRVRGRWRIGGDFLVQAGLLGEGQSHGMMDRFADYARPDFPAGAIDPRICAFYEQTDAYALQVTLRWAPGWRWAGPLYKRLSQQIEQMNFPDAREPTESDLDSRIVPVAPTADGRTGVRAWVRRYRITGRALYVALYAPYVAGGQTYMHITFPLPALNLTTVLRLDGISQGASATALWLTTLATAPDDLGVQGVYLGIQTLAVRLPMNETIVVWALDAPAAAAERCATDATSPELMARHDVWLFGQPLLTLDYTMAPRSIDRAGHIPEPLPPLAPRAG